MTTLRIWSRIQIGVISLLLMLAAPIVCAEETAEPEVPVVETAVSNNATISDEALRAYLGIQEQVHQAQLASDERTRSYMEQMAQKSSEALAETSKNLNSRLQELEQKLSTQRSEETKLMLYVLSAFGALSFVAVVITAYFQWHTVNRLADFTAAVQNRPTNPSVLPFSEAALLGAGQLDQANNRLIGAVERLEKRILELESTARPSLATTAPSLSKMVETESEEEDIPAPAAEPVIVQTDEDETVVEGESEIRIKRLLDRGQSLLNEDKPEAAIEAFDAVLAVAPQHTEALVKKGSALEKLRKLNEAIECYDLAIAADSNMTIAYLYKGGLYNRLERFSEAVECYEKALQTQEKRSAA